MGLDKKHTRILEKQNTLPMSQIFSRSRTLVIRSFCFSRILEQRLSRPRTGANTGQTSAALSERNASYQDPGFRFAHRFAPPWAKVSYAFGVFPDAPPDNNSTSEPFVTLNTCETWPVLRHLDYAKRND